MSQSLGNDAEEGPNASAWRLAIPGEAKDLARRLNERSLRATPPRLAVFRLLDAAPFLTTHAEVAKALRVRGIDQSTVHRALNEFVAAGLARRIAFGDSMWRYEAVRIDSDGPSLRRYFLCADCDTAFRLPDQDPAADAQESLGLVDEAVLKGRCRDCCERLTA